MYELLKVDLNIKSWVTGCILISYISMFNFKLRGFLIEFSSLYDLLTTREVLEDKEV